MRSVWVRLWLVTVVWAAVAAPAQAVVGFDVNGVTALTGQYSRTQTYSGSLTLVDQKFGASLGGVVGSPPAAFGAEVHGSITPTLGLTGSIVSNQYATFGASVNATTQVRGADAMASSKVGEIFTLSTMSTQTGANFMNSNDEVSASVDMFHGLKLDAGGQGCFSGCIGAGFKVDLGRGSTNLLSVTSAGDAYVLGQSIGASPFSYTDPTNILTINGGVPDLDAFAANVAGGPAISSRQGLVGMSVDLAQVFATAVGLPFNLSGELGGFDYTILSAKIGAGLDVVKNFSFEPLLAGVNYVFSAPVSVFDQATGAWSDLTTSWFTKADGGDLQVKAPGAASLGITRYDALAGNLVTDVNLVGYVSGSLTALGLSGYGVDLGPLLNETIKKDIGSISMGSYSQVGSMVAVGQTFNLTFGSNLIDGHDPCEGGCSITGFVDQRDFSDEVDAPGELYDSKIRLVTNLGIGCGPQTMTACNFDDENFEPISRQILQDQLDLQPVVSGEALSSYFRALNTSDYRALQSSDDEVLTRIRLTGLDPLNPTPFGGNGPGAPVLTAPVESRYSELSFSSAAPEPSAWLLMMAGFGLTGAAMRRRVARA